MRAPISNFSKAMDMKLRRHDDNRGSHGWRQDTLVNLRFRLEEEVRELETAIGSDNPQRIMEEAVDVGNFAMMIFDKAKRGEL